MNINSRALAVLLLSSAFFFGLQSADAQNSSTPPTTATRPSAPDQTSLPNAGPPASTTQTTGQVNQDPTVKQMNEKEKGKVERQGK
jgi:hypothetical protein